MSKRVAVRHSGHQKLGPLTACGKPINYDNTAVLRGVTCQKCLEKRGMSIFGWSYPPGAANDPNAPYNQDEGWAEDYCPECKETYSPEWLAILVAGDEPPGPYPMCSAECDGAEEDREFEAAERATELQDWDW